METDQHDLMNYIIEWSVSLQRAKLKIGLFVKKKLHKTNTIFYNEMYIEEASQRSMHEMLFSTSKKNKSLENCICEIVIWIKTGVFFEENTKKLVCYSVALHIPNIFFADDNLFPKEKCAKINCQY